MLFEHYCLLTKKHTGWCYSLRITEAKQISQSLGIPLRTLQRYLNVLKSDGKIEFRGPPKTGGYFVVGDIKY